MFGAKIYIVSKYTNILKRDFRKWVEANIRSFQIDNYCNDHFQGIQTYLLFIFQNIQNLLCVPCPRYLFIALHSRGRIQYLKYHNLDLLPKQRIWCFKKDIIKVYIHKKFIKVCGKAGKQGHIIIIFRLKVDIIFNPRPNASI